MKRLAIVLNPGSGKSETSESEISKLFKTSQFELNYFAIKQGVDTLTKAIHAYEPQAVVAVGGDGTVNAVAGIAVKLKLPMGVIPAGTLNHFAKDMNLPEDPAKAAAVIARLRTTSIDYGSINDRVFVNNCNLGGYPEVVIKRDELTGVLNKWIAALIAAVRVKMHHRRQTFNITIDGKTMTTRAGSIFIGNNPYELEGAKLTSRPQLNQGKLQAVIVKTGRLRHLIGIMINFILGRSHEKVDMYEAKKVTIDSQKEQLNVAVDGEVVRVDTPLTIAIHAKGLEVLV